MIDTVSSVSLATKAHHRRPAVSIVIQNFCDVEIIFRLLSHALHREILGCLDEFILWRQVTITHLHLRDEVRRERNEERK